MKYPKNNVTKQSDLSSTVNERPGKSQAIVVATGFFTLFSLIGIMFYGLPFFYDFWVKELGWSRAKVTSGDAVAKIVVGLFGFFVGWLMDKFGPKRLMVIGVLMCGLAFIGLGHFNTLWQFYFFYILSATSYLLAGALPNQVLISRWFTSGRGKAMGIAYLGVGVGGMLVPQIARWLNTQYGWHNALTILGIMIIAISLPLVLLVKDAPPGFAQTSSTDKKKKIPMSQLFKSRRFVLLVIGSVCSIAAVAGTIKNLKLFFSLDLQFTQEHAANILSIILFSSILGRLLMGWLADKFSKKYVMVLIYALVAISIPLLYFTHVPGVIYLFAFLFGVALGGDYMIIPLMAAELFGVKVLGRIMGLVLTFDGFGDALSPMLVSWIRDKSGSYANGFAVLILLAIIGTIAILLIPEKKKTGDEPVIS